MGEFTFQSNNKSFRNLRQTGRRYGHNEVRPSHVSDASAARNLLRASGVTTMGKGAVPDTAFD